MTTTVHTTERASGSHWIGGWMVPGVGVDMMKKTPAPAWNRNMVAQPAASN